MAMAVKLQYPPMFMQHQVPLALPQLMDTHDSTPQKIAHANSHARILGTNGTADCPVPRFPQMPSLALQDQSAAHPGPQQVLFASAALGPPPRRPAAPAPQAREEVDSSDDSTGVDTTPQYRCKGLRARTRAVRSRIEAAAAIDNNAARHHGGVATPSMLAASVEAAARFAALAESSLQDELAQALTHDVAGIDGHEFPKDSGPDSTPAGGSA